MLIQATNKKQDTTNYQKKVTENAIVKKCIDLIANNASRVEINLFRGDQEVDDHPLKDLLYSPNPTQGQVEFFKVYIHIF